MSIRFITIGKLAADTLPVSYSHEPKYSRGFLNESSLVFKKLNSISLSPEERQKIKTANGEWFCLLSQQQVAYAVLCTIDYPERHAYGLIREAQAEAEKIPDQEQKTQSSQLKPVKRTLEKLAKKYSKLESFDKLEAAKKKVEETKEIMAENIRTQMINNSTLEHTLETSGKLKELSLEFFDNSAQLKKIQQKKLLRIKIIIGLLILAGIGVGIWLLIRDK